MEKPRKKSSRPIGWALLIGLVYGCLFGYLSTFSLWLGAVALLLVVGVLALSLKQIGKIGESAALYWLALYFGTVSAAVLIIMLPNWLMSASAIPAGYAQISTTSRFVHIIESANNGINAALNVSLGFLFGRGGFDRDVYRELLFGDSYIFRNFVHMTAAAVGLLGFAVNYFYLKRSNFQFVTQSI
ncbi:MAG: hypothetical protein AAGD96_12645 [Chloroflexota bacterium]